LRKSFLLIYNIIAWLLLFVVALAVLIFFFLESPSTLLTLAEKPLREQGISYGKMEGSLLTGFTLSDVNYLNKIEAKRVSLKVDFKKLEQRVLFVENLVVKDLKIEEQYLASLLDANATSEESNSTLPFDKIIAKNVDISLLNTKYKEYEVYSARVKVNNLESDMKEKHKGNLSFVLDSNVAQVDMDAKFKNETYSLNGVVEGEQNFLNPFLKENQIVLTRNPKFNLLVDGNMELLNYEISSKNLALRQNEYWVKGKSLRSKGSYNLKSQDYKGVLFTELNSNVATLKLDGKSSLNLNDINNTLSFAVDMNLDPKEMLFTQQLSEQNITLAGLPHIDLRAKGDMKNTDFTLNLEGLKVNRNAFEVNLKSLELEGSVQALKGNTKVRFATAIKSSASEGKILGETAFNFNDINNTLYLDAQADALINTDYVNKFLKESNVTISGETPVKLTLKGDMGRLEVKTLTSTYLLTQGIRSKVKLETTPIVVDLKSHQIKGSLAFNSSAKNIALELKNSFEGDYLEPKKMTTTTHLVVNSFDAFGVNLTSLVPLVFDVNHAQERAELELNSKKIKLKAESRDLDHVNFSINTGNIYLYKIMELPDALNKKFVKLHLNGSATISKQYFSLKGALVSNREFKLNVDATNSSDGLRANLFSQYFKLHAKGNLSSKDVSWKVNIDSLQKFQKEIQRIYAFEVQPVEGSLLLTGRMKGGDVFANISSEKLKFKDFNAEKVEVDAYYSKDLLTLNKLSFNTTGFEQESLNQQYYLNKKATVHFGERRDVFLDMHPKILITANGDKENLKARLEIEALPLGHPEYGDMLLSCDIDYIQNMQKKKIVGGVFIDKLKLFYESKYLDPSYDNDVIVLTKKDKKERTENKGSFLEDTYIDLSIYSPDANYKTRDIELEFTVNVNANKKFGESLRMLGKVEEIRGRVEQAPKLFTVVDSAIVFKGAKEINPLLDIRVDHELPDVLIHINIHGNPKRPKLTFTSEPPLPKKDILSYLLLGVSTANLAEGKGSLGREAQLFIMNQAARDLAYEVELDRVFIKDDGTGEGFAVQVGKRVKEDTMIILENSKEGNSLILEYDVSKNIKVEIGHHQKTVPSQSIDIYFRKRFK